MLEDEEKQHLKDAPLAIPDILLKVLEQDLNIETAYLCHSAVRYIGKVKTSGKSEGNNFCGYHNIQMLISYLHVAETDGLDILASGVPTVQEIQDMIEDAWDQGFNESGRVQTGGIRGTRKHIGTPEVCTMLSNPVLLGGTLTASPNRYRCQIARSESMTDRLTGSSAV